MPEINIPPILGTSTVHTLTIEESDYPYGIIELYNSVYSVREGQLAEIRVNRDRGTIVVQSVQFSIVEGRAKLGEDINTGGGTLMGTLIFQEGSAVSYTQLQIIDDTTPEDTENLAVFLDSIIGSAVFGTITSAEIDIEISDDPFGVIGFNDNSMLLNVRDPTVSEGDLYVSLTVDRVRGTMGSVEVQYQVIPTHPLQQGTFSSVLVYWEAVGNVTSSDIEPLNGSVELPHWDGAVSAYPNYNLTFLLLSDTQAEDKQVFSIRLTGTSSLTEIDSTANSVTISIRANDYPHGVFSIDPNSMLISLNQELLSRMLNFTIVRNQGLQSAATVFYSLYYTDYGYTDSVHILSSSLIVPDAQMEYEEYIPISVSTFIGTNGNLTLRLTSVTAEGTAVTGLPPRIDKQNSYAILTVLEHQANARISLSESSLFPTVNDLSNTVNIVLEREGSFGNITIGFQTGQSVVVSPLTNGDISPGEGELTFLPSERTKNILFSLSPNLLTSTPEIFSIRLVESVYSQVRSLPSVSAGSAVVEPRGVVGIPADQLILRVMESQTFAMIDVLRLFGSSESIYVSYTTESADRVNTMFEELALANIDYNITQGLLRLDSQQTRQQIRVPLAEGDETPGVDKLFKVTLSAVVDSTSLLSSTPRLRNGYMTSLVIIVDDDSPAGVFSFSQNKLIVQEEFQLLVITIVRDTSGVIFPANISVRTVMPELGTELGIDYRALGVNIET